jgi:hypothetical protein
MRTRKRAASGRTGFGWGTLVSALFTGILAPALASLSGEELKALFTAPAPAAACPADTTAP